MLYAIFIAIHIAAGSIGLLTGTIATIATKGKKIHLLAGKIFFYSMVVTAISAMIVANLPNHNSIFLFAVGGFTFYMTATGYRMIFLKRKLKNTFNPINTIDYLISIFGLLFGLYLLFLRIRGILLFKNMFSIVPGVFGAISVIFVLLDSRFLIGKKTITQIWLSTHIARMLGSVIAAYTAFLVVNIQIQQSWILWLLPTLIGTLVVGYFMKKYVYQKGSKRV